LVAVDDTFCISDLKRTQSLMKKFNVESLGIVENMSENVDSSGNIEESVRIKDELKDNILFSLPRIKRNEFYQEVKQLDKLKKYFPNNLLQK